MVIYTTGHPRSGNTWLDRLLSDVLDSPISNVSPEPPSDKRFCRTGTGGHIIRKTHWRPDQWEEGGDGDKVVFIQRDPRDVPVSAMYYRSLLPTDEYLMNVIKTLCTMQTALGKYAIFYGCNYETFVRTWLTYPIVHTRYEDLHALGGLELCRIVAELGIEVSIKDCEAAFDRQRFDRHKMNYPHSMRKGIVGDWRNHYRREHGEMLTSCLGELMIEQGYIDDLNWWRELG